MTPDPTATAVSVREPDLPPRKRLSRAFSRPLAWLAAVLVTAAAWTFADLQLRDATYAELSRTALSQVELYYTGIESELARFEHAPAVFHLDPDIIALLTRPTPEMRNRVNRKLASIAQQVQASSFYVVAPAGEVVAASDWNEGFSPLGRNWRSTRPVGEALNAGSARSYSSGPVRDNPKFTFARNIEDAGRVIGVAVMQADLSGIEKSWWPGEQRAMLVDQNGGVILSSTSVWKYKVIPFLVNESTSASALAARYNSGGIAALDFEAVTKFDDGAVLLRILTPTTHGMSRVLFVGRSLTIPSSGWTVVALIDATNSLKSAANGALAIALAVALVSVLAIFLNTRRQVLKREQAAHDDLEHAYSRLEERVQEKTAELRQTNGELLDEVAERKRAQQHLMRAQDQLVQAGKLATLGQMAAGITHELSQPLQALNMYCNNAQQLNERSQPAGVARNLGAIREISEKMERITSQLRGFARKDSLRLEAVNLQLCARKAVDILSSRIKQRRGNVVLHIPEGVLVLADGHRLEQVFINLVGNGLDAAAAGPAPRVEIRAEVLGDSVRIRVADNGPGIPPAVMGRLFEPFFTTKSGVGLGLGLVITASILRALGTELVPGNGENGGAQFEFSLKGVDHV